MFWLFVICSKLLILSLSQSVSPNWTETSSISAGTKVLFTSLAAAGTTQSFFVLYSTMLSTNPYLAYGLKKYRAEDYILQQYFAMVNTAQDFMSFTVQVSFTGVTNLLYYQISYIAIDPTFYPYYINAFTQVPLNFNSLLTNFSTVSASLQYHYEEVDYTNDQNANYVGNGPGSLNIGFVAPFSNYRIALFLTKLFITSTYLVPVTFDIKCNIISSTTYSMNMTFGYNGTITGIQFSQIFINMGDYSLTSNKYLIFNELEVTDTATSTFYPYAVQLTNNFMMGLKSFSTVSGQCILEYQWINTTVNSTYGAQIQASVPINSSACGLSGSVNTIFFFLAWSCPNPYIFFNITTKMCQTSCGPYTYTNVTDNTCHPCNNTICYTCSVNNSYICLTCDINYILVNNTCICDVSNYLYIYISPQCFSCDNLLTNCATCSYTASSLAPYDATKFICISCNSTLGYFIDSNNDCVKCTISHCTTCSGLLQCSVCQATYGVTSAGQCSTCPLDNCITCTNLTACSVCQAGYLKINNLCFSCPVTCTCGGYTLPKHSNGDCSTKCGDSILIFPYESCDDGNAVSGDGCSSTCQIQTNTTCVNAANVSSLCYLNTNLVVTLADTKVSASDCNTITFYFSISPNLLAFSRSNINWTGFLTTSNSTILNSQLSQFYANGLLQITYTYTQTIHWKYLTFSVNPLNLLSPSIYFSQTDPSIITVQVMPSNNIAAIYCSSQICHAKRVTASFSIAETSVSYIGLFMSIFSCKIVGLEMFGVLQLSYFSLGDYDYINPVLASILKRKQINGLNLDSKSNQNNQISSRVQENGFGSSNFLDNFNLMFLFTVLIAFVGIAIYLATYLINKDSLEKQNLKQQLKSSDHQKILPDYENKPVQESRSMFWHRISKYILKEVLLTFMIFNMFNLSYSAGIQIMYINQVDSFSIVCMLIAFTMTIFMILAQTITEKQEFGEYINKFKPQKYQSRYMVATILYRFTLGFLMAILNEWIESGIIFLAVSSAFLTYIYYFEPFNDNIQNIRSKVVHSIHILILFINFYYRMESNNNEVESGELMVPAYLEIFAVAVCVFGSTAMIGYELFKKIKDYIESRNQGKIEQKRVQVNQLQTIQQIAE